MILEFILVMTIILSVIAIELKDLLWAVVVLGAADILVATAFYFMAAPDIALVQVAITTGLSVFIFMVVIFKTRRLEDG